MYATGNTLSKSRVSCIYWSLSITIVFLAASEAFADSRIRNCNNPNFTPREVQRCRWDNERNEAEGHVQRGEDDPESYADPYASALVEERDGINQLDQQKDAKGNKADGAAAAAGLGGMLNATSIAMIATGVAMNASSHCGCAGMGVIAGGVYFGLGSGGAYGAAEAMNLDANLSGLRGTGLGDLSNFDGNLDNIALQNLNDPNGNNSGGFVIGGTGANGANGATGSSIGANIGANAEIAANTASGFKADTNQSINSKALREGKVGEAFDQLEEKFGIDRDAFAKAIASREDIPKLLKRTGIIQNEDDFRKQLQATEIDKEQLAADFNEGKFDEYKDIVEGAGVDFANKGKGLEQGKGIDPSASFDAMVAGMAKEGAEAKSLREILGLGKAKSKNGTAGISENKDGSGASRTIASLDDKDYALIDAQKVTGDYVEATIFERVHQKYKSETSSMLSTDWYIRNRLVDR